MPVVNIRRTGFRSAPRDVPADTSVVILPVTLERVGQETGESEQPALVHSTSEAFEAFTPGLDFRITVGDEGAEFQAQLEFHSLADFDPRRIRPRESGRRDDLSDLQSHIYLLHSMRERFEAIAVRRAWEMVERREQAVDAVHRFHDEVRRIANGGERSPADSADEATAIRCAQDLIAGRAAGKAIEEILNVFHPAPPRTPLAEIFSAETARYFMDRVGELPALLTTEDTYDEVLRRLDAAINRAEAVRDAVLEEIHRRVRPLEMSYRLLDLFFDNAKGGEHPVELHVFDADPRSIRRWHESPTIAAVNDFIQSRNDTFNFRMFVSHLVVPGYVPDEVRRSLGDIARRWGVVLVTDLRDERTFRQLIDQFRTDGGSYEFLKRPREDAFGAEVVLANYVKLRDRYWFEAAEPGETDADLYAPPSLPFAGVLIRTDRTKGGDTVQGPVGVSFGTLRGARRARFEMRRSQLEYLPQGGQIVTIVSDDDGDLWFVESEAPDDPLGTRRYFGSYRVLRYIEQRINTYLRRIAGQRLTRDVVKEQVRNPIENFMDQERRRGTVYQFDLDVDMDNDKFAQGILEMSLEVMPSGSAEIYRLRFDTPSAAQARSAPAAG